LSCCGSSYPTLIEDGNFKVKLSLKVCFGLFNLLDRNIFRWQVPLRLVNILVRAAAVVGFFSHRTCVHFVLSLVIVG